MSGPTEFGELPLEDRVFWNRFLEEKIRRMEEEKENGSIDDISNSSKLSNL